MSGIVESFAGKSREVDPFAEWVHALASARSRDEVVGVLSGVTGMFPCSRLSAVSLLNNKHTFYNIQVLRPSGVDPEFNSRHFSIATGMPGWVVRNRSSVIVDVSSAPEFHEDLEGKLREAGIRSLMLVPLQAGEDILGTLMWGSSDEGTFTQEDLSFAKLVGMQTAVSFKNLDLFESVDKKLTQIELVNTIAGRISSTLDLHELLSSAAEIIQKAFNFFDVTIFLADNGKEYLTLVAHSGSYIDFLPHGFRQRVGDGIIGWAAEHNQTLLANDVSQDERYISHAYHNTNSELAIPLSSNNEVLGILNIEETLINAFDKTDLIVLETLAGQLGSAIRNAKLFDELNRTNDKLSQLDRMRSEFLGIVSHDFRSPLSSIILATKSLLRRETVRSDPRVAEYLKIISDQAMRLNYLAEEILSITRLESGQLTYHFKIVNIQTLVDEAVSLVTFSHKHRLEYSIDPGLVYIKGDEQKIRQVLHNIVANAVKYSPQGGIIELTIAEHPESMILVSVRDEGIGIPSEKQEVIFRKFGRIESEDTRGIKGSGLGLWISREIIRAHGGEIWFESEPGNGTRFFFTLKKAQ